MIEIIGVILINNNLDTIKNIYVLCLLIILLLFGLAILSVSDYVEKYWLYNDKIKAFY